MCRRTTVVSNQTPAKATWSQKEAVSKPIAKTTTSRNKTIMNTKSKLFQCSETNNCNLGLFYRDEIIKGNIVGQGAFSEVWEIENFKLRSTVRFNHEEQAMRNQLRKTCKNEDGTCRFVIKHLKPSLMEKPNTYQKAAADLIKESHFLSQFDHPNIIKIRGLDVNGEKSFNSENKEGFFMIMDKLDEILTQKIESWKKGGYERQTKEKCYSEKVKCAYQVASALEYLHEQNFIFRDLKPDNIGFKDGQAQIFDFGLCRDIPTSTKSDAVFEMSGVGTRRYMAPEVILNKGYNLRADVYSWAIVFYEMLSLQRAFDVYSRQIHRILICQEGRRPQLDAYLPQEVQSLIHGAWANEPSNRLSMKEICVKLAPLASLADQQMESLNERSMQVISELSDIFCFFPTKLPIQDPTNATDTMSSLFQ